MMRWATGGGLALVLLLVEWLAGPHGSGWHAWPGFDLVYGLAGCAAIVVVSKAFGRAGIQQSEDFYGEDDGGAA